MRSVVNIILVDYTIPISIGVLVLLTYGLYPEKFPRKLTPAYVRLLALVLIVGSLLLAIWDAYIQSR